MPGLALWRAIGRDQLCLRCWDDDCIVYNDATGHTHLVSPIAATMLRILLAAPHPLAAAELASRLAAHFGTTGDDELTTLVEETLADLEHSNVIERVREAG